MFQSLDTDSITSSATVQRRLVQIHTSSRQVDSLPDPYPIRKKICEINQHLLLILAVSVGVLAISPAFVAFGLQSEHAQSSSPPLSLERIAAEPDSDERANSLHWNPDSTQVAWLQFTKPAIKPILSKTGPPQREVWALDSSPRNPQPQKLTSMSGNSANGSILISAAKVTEALRGEATTRHHSSEDDEDQSNPYLLQDFAWSQNGKTLLLFGAQSIASFDITAGTSRLLVHGGDAISGTALSPDGRTISFIRNHSLWLVAAAGGTPRALVSTHQVPSPRKDILVGEPDWLYRNELHLTQAYQWAPDSSRIAYLQTDDHAVDKYTLRSSTGQAREIVYPHPGSPLPLVHVFTVQLADGTPVEMRTDPANGFYLPLLRWLPDSRHLAIERIDRFQRNLELLLSDSQTGRTKTIVTETDKYWINISDILYFFHDGKSFLWSSERSGFRHLYLYSSQGKQLSQITKGDWEVTCLDAVDEKRGLIYFTATMQSPLERQLYRLHLDGSDISRITQQPGTHEPHFASDATHFVDQFSSHAIAPQLTIASVDHSSAEDKLTLPAVLVPETANIAPSITHHDDAPTASSTLHAEQAPAAPDLLPVEFLPIKLHLGAETSAFLIRPPNFDPTHKYPVILYVAGGPGEQLVRDAWGGAAGLWMQSMAQNGFIVFALDNQGTSGRGHYFEEPIHLRLGAQELADQRDGLVYLANLPYVDVKRLGICGWGYGGFLVLHAMLDRPVPFKVGFAGAPVADWHLYDATFAEKYLDDPVAHADGWSASTAFENDTPRFFKGSLMVAQGTEDEFVHLENTARIQQELLNAGKFVTNLSFPDRGHSIKDFPARIGLYRAMTDFFVKNL